MRDRRILYELTKRRVMEEDYHNDTSFEDGDDEADHHEGDAADHPNGGSVGLLVDEEEQEHNDYHHLMSIPPSHRQSDSYLL